MGVRGPQPQEGALRRNGWRPPPLPGLYKDLVLKIFERPEFSEASAREVMEAALRAFATTDELDQVGLPKERTMNSYQIAVLRESDPTAAYQKVLEEGEGIYVWKSAGKYSPITSQDYDTIEGLRHGVGDVYSSFQTFSTAADAAQFSTPIPNAMADAYLRDIGRGRSGSGFRVF